LKHEACIVGGGPSGTLVATKLASKGFNTVIFEEHSTIGVPNHCAGLISVKGLARLGIKPNPDFYQNNIYGGRIYSPDGEFIEIRDSRPRAHVIDRASFDQYLAHHSENEGAIIHKNQHVKQVKKGKIRINNDWIPSELVINAEGAGGRLMRRSGLGYNPPKLIMGYNTEIEGVDVDPELVEIWFGEDITKDFFAWVIPIDEKRVRAGLGTSSNKGLEKIKSFIKKRFNKNDLPLVNAGQICVGGPVRRTVYDNILLVGDVAGQVKATTGGGVIIGGLCAQIAGEAASEYLEGRSSLVKYDNLWRNKYGFELKSMCTLRKILNRVDDDRFNKIFHRTREKNIEDKLQHLLETGDLDMQSSVIRNALFDPTILSILVKGMGELALSELFSLFR
jgi:geranylgeranyl reductase family protein